MSRLEFPGPVPRLERHLTVLRDERARQRAARESLDRRIGLAVAAARGMPGLTVERAAEMIGVSKPTAYRCLGLVDAGPADDLGAGDGLGAMP